MDERAQVHDKIKERVFGARIASLRSFCLLLLLTDRQLLSSTILRFVVAVNATKCCVQTDTGSSAERLSPLIPAEELFKEECPTSGYVSCVLLESSPIDRRGN